MLLVFGTFWIWQAGRLPFSSPEGGPGPGLLPTVLGVILVTLAATSFLRPEVGRIELPYFRRIAMILGALIGYALLLEPLGYVVTTTLVLGFLLVAFADRRSVWQPISAFAVSFGTYYVFRILLSVPLPPDPLDLVR